MNKTRLSFSLFICLGLVLGVLFYGACAQASASGPQLNLKAGQSLTGRFVHEHPVQGFDKPMLTEGAFALVPSKQMQWMIQKPMATTTVIDAGGLTQRVGTFVLLKMTPQQMPFLADVQDKLLWALNGEWKKLEKDFVVKRSAKGSGWQVALTPRNLASAPFQRLVATGGRFVDKVSIEMRQSTDTIVFTEQAIGKAP